LAKTKRKLLPKEFGTLLDEGNLAALKAVFDTCDVDARGGYSKRTALASAACPDELARWLVENGADVAAVDRYGETPLHSRAGHWQANIEVLLELGADIDAVDSRGETPLHRAAGVGNVNAARLLLQRGARVDTRNRFGLTPLAAALQQCHNARIAGMAEIAELLLDADGPPKTGLRALAARLIGAGQPGRTGVTPEMQAQVRKIGTEFEWHRPAFNPDLLEEASAGLDRLYQLFDVAPVPRRMAHDGKSPIVATAATWQERHQELWELLVPSRGAATTVQGEVIRISGRLHTETEDNGGVNWDDEFKKMADAFLIHLGSAVPLPAAELAETAETVRAIKARRGDTVRMCELATSWVALNPEPIELPLPDYDR
jgi:hypothetical protein